MNVSDFRILFGEGCGKAGGYGGEVIQEGIRWYFCCGFICLIFTAVQF